MIPTDRYGPRAIDVDILTYDDLVLSTTTTEGPLIVPHERIPERDFVLVPFRDIAPGAIIATPTAAMAEPKSLTAPC